MPTTLGNTPLPPLLRRIKNLLDTNPVATIEEWAVEDLPSQSRHEIETRQSIYSSVSVADGPILRMAGVEPSIRVAGHYIGADKLGHFMAQGFEYFEILWRSGNVQDALTYGRGLEDGPYGIRTTGVRSFGDLGANFSGMTFYCDLLFGSSPLIVCENGQFRVARRFRWSAYVNDSWDEGVNCSEYNPGVTHSVQAALQARRMTCPVQNQSCVRLQALPCSRHFVSPACQGLWPASAPAASCPRALAGLPTQLALGGPTSPPRPETAEACGPLGVSGELSPPATALLRAWEEAESRLFEGAPESQNLSEDRNT